LGLWETTRKGVFEKSLLILISSKAAGAEWHKAASFWARVAALAAEVQQVTGDTVELAFVDQGYTGPNAAEAAAEHGIRLEVVKHPMAKRGFVLLPRRWVVERSFAWAARLRRLARDYERLPNTLKGLHYIAFAILMTAKLVNLAAQIS
jgi:transposase